MITYVLLVSASLFLLIGIGIIDTSVASPGINNASTVNTSGNLTLSLYPDYDYYTDEFQTVNITAVIGKQNGSAMLILEARDNNGTLERNQSAIARGVSYPFQLFPGKIGTHNVTVKAIQNGNVVHSWVTYKVISFWQTYTVGFLLAALVSFGALLISISLTKTNNTKAEILRFVFLSGIVVSVLGALFFIQTPYGAASPVGLVAVNNQSNNVVATDAGAQWKIKVGGELYIPLYVIVLGLLGGYLRYLYKTSRLLTDPELREEIQDIRRHLDDIHDEDKERKVIFFESLKDVALFILAPILATVAWFLFSQWQPIENSTFLLAVISFASGLTTTEIVAKISDFTRT